MASTHIPRSKLVLAMLLVTACPADDQPANPTSATEASATSGQDTDAADTYTSTTADPTTLDPTTTASPEPTESDGSTGLSPPACGDGHLDPGEACDLGPQNADDGPCTLECALAKCGDGHVQPGEQCDLGMANANDGPCTLACAEATCGDGFLHAGVEACDDGDANDADIYNGCHPVTCTRVSWCGDGVTQPEEECDPKDPNVPELTCTDECQIVRKIIFVTSVTFMGKLGGLTGADQTCQKLAGAAGLKSPTTFRAWLSDGFEPVTDRIDPFEGPYIRPDGIQIADNWQDLTDGDLDAPISVDETKQDHTQLTVYVWTNIAADGGFDGHTSCEGWNKLPAGKTGRVGTLDSTSATWTHHSELLCVLQAHLYCVEG